MANSDKRQILPATALAWRKQVPAKIPRPAPKEVLQTPGNGQNNKPAGAKAPSPKWGGQLNQPGRGQTNQIRGIIDESNSRKNSAGQFTGQKLSIATELSCCATE